MDELIEFSEFSISYETTSFPGSLSIVVEKTNAGHVALVDKHVPTGVVFSFNWATAYSFDKAFFK